MAYDKLVDSSALDSNLGDVADAIRAKSGGSSQLAFPSGFISEIGNISTGGGGGLPTGMTNIGSGSFTFASRTVLNTAINHGLSFTPRAIIIWTNAELSTDMFYCLLTRQLADNTGTYKSTRHLVVKASSEIGVEISHYGSSDVDLFITSTTFNVGNGSRYYAAGATYNWVAFA